MTMGAHASPLLSCLAAAVLLLARPAAAQVMITYDPSDPTAGSLVTFTTTNPDSAVSATFQNTDTVNVVTAGSACDTGMVPDGVSIGATTRTATSASTPVTFTTPGQYLFCYIQLGMGAGVNTAVDVRGATPFTMPAEIYPIEAGGQEIVITGVGLESVPGNDRAKLVAAGADCLTGTAVHLCCENGEPPLAAAATPATQITYTIGSQLGYAGEFTLCYRLHSATTATNYQALGTVNAYGPAGYSPRRVAAGTFTLQFDGFGLTPGAMQDTVFITSDTTCDDTSANVLTRSSDLVDPMHMTFDTSFTGTITAPGTGYSVCYQVQGLTMGAMPTTYFKLREPLAVTGATSYAPTSVGGAGAIELTFQGVLLDSTNVGDSVKIVQGADCLSDAAIVEGGIPNAPQFVPAGQKDQSQLSITLDIMQGGIFTVCFKSSESGEYVPLAPALEVAGAASFTPTAVSIGFVGDLTFTGVSLNNGDAVHIIHADDGQCDNPNAIRLTWSAPSTTQGFATVADPSPLTKSGNYRVCFTPQGGNRYEMKTPLVVSGAQSISPTVYIAGVDTLTTLEGINLSPMDSIKFVDQALETCDPGFPTHGTIVPLATSGQYTVTFGYGGLFTLCYRPASSPEYIPAATVTVRGAKRVSPFLPIVASVGVPTEFELEGYGLSALDSLNIIDDSAGMGCADAQAVPVPPLTVTTSELVTTGFITFNVGGEFLVCYTVSGGPALAQPVRLSVKGPSSVTPIEWNFGVETTLTITGLALSTQDTVRLVTGDDRCEDDDVTEWPIMNIMPVMGQVLVTAEVKIVSPVGGTYLMCYKPFEGGYVVLPQDLLVKGAATITPEFLYANRATRMTIDGQGLAFGSDEIMMSRIVDNCASEVFGSRQPVTAASVEFTPTEAGEFLLCYKLSGMAAFVPWRRINVFGVTSFSPTSLEVSYAAKLTIRGTGLDPRTDRLAIMDRNVCPSAPPTGGPNLQGDNTTVIFSTALLQGSAESWLCYFMDGEWFLVPTPLRVLGPISRAITPAGTPFIAGAAMVFQITGEGLLGGFDKIRWARRRVAASTVTEELCATPLIPDGVVSVSFLTPTVQLPGGSYVMCYSLGSTGVFVPVGAPLGGEPGGVTGEVVLAGPSGYFVTSPQPAATARELVLGFDNLVDTAEYRVALCRGGDAADLIPLANVAAGAPSEVAFSGSAVGVYPLRGGSTQVCFKAVGGAYIPLPEIPENPADRNTDSSRPLDPAGTITINGPTAIALPVIDGLERDLLPAGQRLTFGVSGQGLSSNQSSVWWSPASEGCLSPTYNPGNYSLATTLLRSETILETVFHMAGDYILCYTADASTPSTVNNPMLAQVSVYGLSRAASTTVSFGQPTMELDVPSNTATPPTRVYLVPHPTALEPLGATSCNVFDDVALTNSPAEGSVAASAVRVSDTAVTYDVSTAPPGYHLVCAEQGDAGYYTLPYLLVVRGPTAVSPNAVVAPGSFRMRFEGPGITDNDRVRLGKKAVGTVPDCASAGEVLSLRNLEILTPRLAEPAEHFVCYELNFPGETGGVMSLTPLTISVTGLPSQLALRGGTPRNVTSMQPFRIDVELQDQYGNVVGGQDSGTFSLSADSSPGLPVSFDENGLTKPCVDGTASFTIGLGTQGIHKILVTFEDAGVVLTVLSQEIEVLVGPPVRLAATFDPTGELTSGDTFTINFKVVDEGYNEVPVANVNVLARMSPLDDDARTGELIGTTTALSDADGRGALADLKITAIGTYRFLLTGTPVDASAVYSSDELDVVVRPGTGTTLVIDAQWGEGFVVYAGQTLSLDAHVEDWGGNKLYVGRPTPFFLSLASDPLPPTGAGLYDTDATVCAQTQCREMVDGQTSYLGDVRFRGFWVNKPGNYRIVVASPTLTATSNLFQVVEGPASHVKVVSGAAQTVRIGEPFNITVDIVDLGGNSVGTTGDIVATDYSASGALKGRSIEPINAATNQATFDFNYTQAGVFTIAFQHDRLSLVGATATIVVVDDGSGTPVPTPGEDGAGDDGMSGLEIALIVIGILLFLLLLCILIWCCTRDSKEEKDLGKEPAGTQPDWEEARAGEERYYGAYPQHADPPPNPLGQFDPAGGAGGGGQGQVQAYEPNYDYGNGHGNTYDSMRRNGNNQIMTPADPMHALPPPPQGAGSHAPPPRIIDDYGAGGAGYSPARDPAGNSYNDPAAGSPMYDVVPSPQGKAPYTHTAYHSGSHIPSGNGAY